MEGHHTKSRDRENHTFTRETGKATTDELVSILSTSCSGELRTQKLKSHLVRTQSLNVLPLKPGVGQFIWPYMLRLLPGISSLLISTFPVHSPAFFPKPLLIFFFPVLAVANTGFCVDLQNKIDHPA